MESVSSMKPGDLIGFIPDVRSNSGGTKGLFEVFDEEYDNRTHLFFSVVDPDGFSSRVCIQFQKRVPGFSFRDPNSTFL